MDEIEDPVPASIHARDQVRPRHRTLWRNARDQPLEGPLLRQSRKVRHLAVCHELGKQVGIEPIDTQNDHFAGRSGPAPRPLAGDKQGQASGAQGQQAHEPNTFSQGHVTQIRLQKVCPASWLTLGGGHDSTPGGDPEEQVPKIVQGLA
jgi:hypothetical protein